MANVKATLDFGRRLAPSTDSDVKRDLLRQGRCPHCGVQTHKVRGLFKSNKPLTVPGRVDSGRCLRCNPDSTGGDKSAVTPVTETTTSISINSSGTHCQRELLGPLGGGVDDQVVNVEETMRSINQTLNRLGAAYHCRFVSWDDVSRNQSSPSGGGGSALLSCWGTNITDSYLKAKDGTKLFTVRPDNWNEMLGVVSTDDVAVVVGNCEQREKKRLHPVTLSDVLRNISSYGKLAKVDPPAMLYNEDLDKTVSIRFQTTFLPVSKSGALHGSSRSNNVGGARESIEFAVESHNRNTRDDANPCNLILLCTSQGMAIQADGKGPQLLFHHLFPADHHGRYLERYWLEAERSDHKVGGAQMESNEERVDALRRGKAVSTVIGTLAMGTRFNVLMTVQVPLLRKEWWTGKDNSNKKKDGDDSGSDNNDKNYDAYSGGETHSFGGYIAEPDGDYSYGKSILMAAPPPLSSDVDDGENDDGDAERMYRTNPQDDYEQHPTGRSIYDNNTNEQIGDGSSSRPRPAQLAPPTMYYDDPGQRFSSKVGAQLLEGKVGAPLPTMSSPESARGKWWRRPQSGIEEPSGTLPSGAAPSRPLPLPEEYTPNVRAQASAQVDSQSSRGDDGHDDINNRHNKKPPPAAATNAHHRQKVEARMRPRTHLPQFKDQADDGFDHDDGRRPAVTATAQGVLLPQFKDQVTDRNTRLLPQFKDQWRFSSAQNSKPSRPPAEASRRPDHMPTSQSSATPKGEAHAARVSLGSKHDDWYGLKHPERVKRRHESERITVTVILYNLVVGGVPTERDIVAAIDDMESLYNSCSGGRGRLADKTFDLFKDGGKLPDVQNHNVFPTAGKKDAFAAGQNDFHTGRMKHTQHRGIDP